MTGERVARVGGLVTNNLPKRDGWSIDLGAVQFSMLRRNMTNIQDDHFNTPTRDAKWIAFGSLLSESLSVLPGWYQFGGVVCGVLQLIPSGDWYIETECLWCALGTTVGWTGTGLMLTNGTNQANGSACAFQTGGQNSAGHSRYAVTRFNNGGYAGNFIEVTGTTDNSNHRFMRIQKSGTTYRFHYSDNPYSWQFFYSMSAGDMGFTPTYFGLYSGATNPSWFNYFLKY
jgi:hypothetical protein